MNAEAITMSTTDSASVESEYKKLTDTPRFAWPTIILFIVCLSGFAWVSYLGVQGGIPLWGCMLINSVFSYLLFSVAHDATHNAISKVASVNNMLGHIGILFFGPLSPLPVARWIHMQHHRYTNDPELDPDVFAHKMDWLTPLRWANFDYFYTLYFLKHGGKALKRNAPQLIIHILVVVSSVSILVWMGYGLEVLMLWILPTRINSILFEIMFVYLPHGPFDTKAQDDPYKATSIRQGLEWLLTPLMTYQNYHLAHHLYPKAPFYNNLKIWKLKEKEHLSKNPRICKAFSKWPEMAD